MSKIIVKDTEINISRINNEDYICITDMLKAKDGDFFIADWLRNRNTLEYIGTWESVYNPDFDLDEFSQITNCSGLNNFKISVKEFVEKTKAMWISPLFKIYIVKEFQRLKNEEQKLLGWSAKRELAKVNYHIHTEAIKNNLIPAELTTKQISAVYADEADVLNMALFGMTAKQWRENYPERKGNIRDHASMNELICLSNMENINAVLIEEGLTQKERLIKLNKIAIQQMSILEEHNSKLLMCKE